VADDILTIEEVAKYLRVSERTVYDWAQKGEIPAGKIGTVWRFKKDERSEMVNERLRLVRQPTVAPSFRCKTSYPPIASSS
jgi:PTS system nitrogen regulatory IIA component